MYNQQGHWVRFKQLLVVLLLTLSVPAFSQIAVDRFSFFTNYNGIKIPNGFNDSYHEGLAWNFGSELQLEKHWSFTLFHQRDYDGYQQLGVPVWGAPLAYYDVRVPWATRYMETFAMVRLYTESNYYSKSYDLRHKDLYGFYFSMGLGIQGFEGRYWSSENFVSEYINDLGEPDFRVESYIDRYEVTVSDWATQFGVGFKNFHTKWVYSDVMLLSSAYSRDNRRISSSIIPDSRRQANDDPLEIDQAEREALTYVWAKNGRGILVLVSIGINLDIYK